MQRAKVLGHAVASAKHATMEGTTLLVAQPLDPQGNPDGDPYLVGDRLGTGIGQTAIISSDGKFAQETLGRTTPVRFMVIGIED
jgi:ethanolamine utilization protein EutN